MKPLILTLLLLTFSTGLFSQDFEVPANYKLESAGDFSFYEQDIINCVNWMTSTPLIEQGSLRTDASIFLVEWLKGNPFMTVKPKKEIVTFANSSPNLVLIFMGGWARYAIEKHDFKNKLAGNVAGIETVIDFYTLNRKDLGRDKNVEKYIKMRENETLIDFIQKNLPEARLDMVSDSSPRASTQ